MKARQYLVIQDHTSEFPEPIAFAKGATLAVGQKYEGPEGWENWVFCELPGQADLFLQVLTCWGARSEPNAALKRSEI